jgi:cytochrome c-type biogenesis protein CcsB
MKKIAAFLFSARLMAGIYIVFAVSIGFATFIENDFGSATARSFVYNARWFELMLLIGAINLTGRIITQRLWTKGKLTIFLFHFAFVFILAGAAITRYTGDEGVLSVREGKTNNRYITNQTFIGITVEGEPSQHIYPVSFNIAGRNRFIKQMDVQGQPVRFKVKSFIPNAIETIEPSTNGIPVAEIFYADSVGRHKLVISKGDIRKIVDLDFAFEKDRMGDQTVFLSSSPDSLIFIAPYPVTIAGMGGETFGILKENIQHRFLPQHLYTFNGKMIVLGNHYHTGEIVPRSAPDSEGIGYDAVVMEVKSGFETKTIAVFGKAGYEGVSKSIKTQNSNFIISYGSLFKQLPFEIMLKDFRIERYAGSGSPSSFESHVVLKDRSRDIEGNHKIYMNNILRYRGYRLYQSSYDADEKGTILSVSKDFAGTFISYTGYLIMAIGMILSLFNPNSRFREIASESYNLKKKIKSFSVIALVFLLSSGKVVQAKENHSPNLIITDKGHAEKFGRMLIQDNQGRIEPISTLSADVVRKLSRKTTYKGQNPDQVFLGMLTHASQWQYEPILRVTNPEIKKLLGSESKYYSYANFFVNNTYLLNQQVEFAFRKMPSERSKLDNEIIRLNEKINICYMVFSGDFLRVFPVAGDSARVWYNHHQINGLVKTKDSTFAESILILYVQEVVNSCKTGNWTSPDQIIEAIGAYQLKYSPELIPSVRKRNIEIWLSHTHIFSTLSIYYGIIGFILLVIQFAGLFFKRLKVKVPVIISIILILSLFIIHTIGLGLRWYVAGHAPLSNGYEALTYISWATVLAGLVFVRHSPMTLSVTSILSFLILFVAHLSWMDPQITNLVPVLRSYWLIIHVATITASYGFLSMGALMAFINLVLMILANKKNKEYLHLHIREFTHTIEMTLTIGLYLLTIGVFLGAVWANESWGRYWGWDPKETWALITVLVYAFILHMRVIPGLKGIYSFNLASLLGVGSVIMTYFGVNYYLSGLHSYAGGDPLPVPIFVYYSLTVVFLAAIAAYIRQKRPY